MDILCHSVLDTVTKFKAYLLRASFLLALFFQPASLFAEKVDYVFETESVSSIGDAADDPAICDVIKTRTTRPIEGAFDDNDDGTKTYNPPEGWVLVEDDDEEK